MAHVEGDRTGIETTKLAWEPGKIDQNDILEIIIDAIAAKYLQKFNLSPSCWWGN